MKSKDIFNYERINALGVEPNAYIMKSDTKKEPQQPQMQNIPKVIFPEPYENASPYYNKQEFNPPPPPPSPPQQNSPMFDLKSLLPLLTQNNMMDIIKPIISMFSGGGNADISKIFELFKPKSKQKKVECKVEDSNSKFDDFNVIID